MNDNEIRAKLTTLPLLWVVAFAARCARRSLALCVDLHDRATIENAIHAAELFAMEKGISTFGNHADHASRVSAHALYVAQVGRTAGTTRAARAAACAADAALCAADAVIFGADTYCDDVQEAAAAAVSAASSAAIWAASGSDLSAKLSNHIKKQMSRELTALKVAMNVRSLSSGTIGHPIDPSETGPLGPLWTESHPKWLEYESIFDLVPDKFHLPEIDLLIDPGAASVSDVSNVLIALSDLHAAYGGLGLKYRIGKTYVLAASEVPK